MIEIIKIALSSLHANKLRSSLTIFGIIVGIFSIISISTIITMLQNSIEEGVSQLGKNTFQIQKFPVMMNSGPSERAKFRNRKDLTVEDYEILQQKLVDAKYIGAEIWGFAKVFKFENKETNPNVSFSGIMPDALHTNDWVIDKGRAINKNDVDRYEKVIVLGADVAKTLFKYRDPIGEEIKVDGYKLRVIGVLENQGASFGQSQNNFALTTITAFQSMYGKRSRSVNITVMSHDKASYLDLIEKAKGEMRLIRKVPPGEDDDFGIFSNESILGQINTMTANVRIGAVVIGLIALLAAGIGIMNIMLVSVTERTKEIGIRKSIGARRTNILFQFLTEAIVLCQIGGIIGIITGVIFGNIIGTFMNASVAIPLDWVAIGLLMCVMVGVGFGTYPAYKASNLDPIEALRFE